MIDLGSLGGTLAGPVTPALKPTSESGGFNNSGQFVGIATEAGDQMVDPFLWDREKLIDLFTETTGENPVSAAALNDAGEVVGGAIFPNRTIDAYLWKNGVALDLGTVEGDGCSWSRAINSGGQVVGQSFACDGSTLHAFLSENGSIVDLNKLIPRSSQLQLVDPLSINDRGEIMRIGLPRGCTLAMGDAACGHAFVLIPCDTDHIERALASGACVESGRHLIELTPSGRLHILPFRGCILNF
jgi:probable HAF family extracellular repeat protein